MSRAVAAAAGARVARGSAWRRPVAALELALWLAGAGLLGLAAWAKGDELWFQRRAAGDLERAWEAPAAVSEVAPRAAIPAGTPIARLSIPRLGENAVVAEGTDATVLRRAVGHLPASARPGDSGNVALAGHRDSFFRGLGELSTGDAILIESRDQRATYRVEWSRVVDPEDTSVVGATDYPALTLVTCYPFRYVGAAPRRYVVRARRVDAEAQILQSAPPARLVPPAAPRRVAALARSLPAKALTAKGIAAAPAKASRARAHGIRLAPSNRAKAVVVMAHPRRNS